MTTLRVCRRKPRRREAPALGHQLPHWNWAGREGQPIPVVVYTNASETELFLDGKSLGRKRRGVDLVELPIGKNVDANLAPLAENLVQFAIEGPGRIVGVDNGNAATVESFRGDRRRAYHGLASVIVRADTGRPGTIRLAATSAGLRPAEISITVNEASSPTRPD